MKLRALVVEDEWAARNYLVELLQGSGSIDVLGAVANADDARQLLDAKPVDGGIDVAFVDVQLVGSEGDDEGLALVRACARSKSDTAPMFVLATAFPQHALEAFDLGVSLKPFTEEALLGGTMGVRVR